MDFSTLPKEQIQAVRALISEGDIGVDTEWSMSFLNASKELLIKCFHEGETVTYAIHPHGFVTEHHHRRAK